MSTGDFIIISAWSGICSVWAGILMLQFQVRRAGMFPAARPYRRPDGSSGTDDVESVCVVIPARNEAANLSACLTRVLAQDYPALSVVLVDDRSEDVTAAIAESIARTDSRVRVERVTALPPGWMGKSHALWQATRLVDSDWLLFTDVDCRLDRFAVTTAVEEARRRGVEMLSLWPRQADGGFWEHMLIPLCAGIIALWFGGGRVNDPVRGAAFANGQFLLIRRAAYELIGGHKSVRAALIEDIPLAERAKRCGVRRHVASGLEIVSVGMYNSFRGILDGWARIYVGSLRSGTKIALSILWLLVGSLLPYLVLITLVGWRVFNPSHDSSFEVSQLVFAGMSGLHLILMLIVSARFWRMGGCPRRYLVLYPLSVGVVVCILARAWWWLMIGGKIKWRENHYTIDREGRIVV